LFFKFLFLLFLVYLNFLVKKKGCIILVYIALSRILRSFFISLFASIFTFVIVERAILATTIKTVNRRHCKNILLTVKSHSKYCCFSCQTQLC